MCICIYIYRERERYRYVCSERGLAHVRGVTNAWAAWLCLISLLRLSLLGLLDSNFPGDPLWT